MQFHVPAGSVGAFLLKKSSSPTCCQFDSVNNMPVTCIRECHVFRCPGVVTFSFVFLFFCLHLCSFVRSFGWFCKAPLSVATVKTLKGHVGVGWLSIEVVGINETRFEATQQIRTAEVITTTSLPTGLLLRTNSVGMATETLIVHDHDSSSI